MTGTVRPASVLVPTEHGGWSLTLEPVVLGLLVAPSGTGFLLGGVALGAFLIRTPLKVVLVDLWRRRWLDRSRWALGAVVLEGLVLAVLVIGAVVAASASWWWPAAAAAPLVAIGIWFDARSRSRRLLPELAGSVGIGAVVAMIALSGGETDTIAAGLWLIVVARVVASLPFVRVQLRRAKEQSYRVGWSDGAQLLGVAIAAGAVVWLEMPVLALVAITLLAVFQLGAVRVGPPRAAILGAQQVVLGLVVVLLTGLAVASP